jgi:hypothetical protein
MRAREAQERGLFEWEIVDVVEKDRRGKEKIIN